MESKYLLIVFDGNDSVIDSIPMDDRTLAMEEGRRRTRDINRSWFIIRE